MNIQGVNVPVVPPLNAPAALQGSESFLSETLKNAINTELNSLLSPALLPQQRTDLLSAFKQAVTDQLSSHVGGALYNGENKEKAQGAGLVLGGAVMQGAGQRLGSSGGMGTKLAGAGLVWLGRTAEEVGKNKYGSAGGSGSGAGGTNAYAGFYKGFPTDGKR